MTALNPKDAGGGAARSANSIEDLNAEVERLKKERDELRGRLDRPRRAREAHARRIFAAVMTVLAVISLVVTIPATWSYRTLFNTDAFVERVAPAVYDPAVTPVLSDRLTNEVFGLLDVEVVVADALPPRAQVLAGPMTTAIRGFVRDQVNGVLQSDQFQTAWLRASRFAHTQVLAVLRGQSDVVATQNGQVVLNLMPVINDVLKAVSAQASGLLGRDVQLPEISQGEVPAAAREKISDALGVQVPDNLGEIVVFDSDNLEAAQATMQFLDRGVVLLVILTLLLLVAAFVASVRRRRTLLQITLGTLVGLVILRRLGFWLEDEIVGRAATPEGANALRAIEDQVLGSFFSLTKTLIIVGLVLLVLALITGPYAWAVSARTKTMALARSAVQAAGGSGRHDSTVAWVRAHREALQLGGGVVAVLLLLLVDLSWIPFLIITALVVAYELALLRIGAGAPPPTSV
jgi:hypothetical protein